MELYIKVSFWMMLIVMILRLFILNGSEYPRTEEKTIGAEIVGIFISTGFILWSGFLLYGSK